MEKLVPQQSSMCPPSFYSNQQLVATCALRHLSHCTATLDASPRHAVMSPMNTAVYI